MLATEWVPSSCWYPFVFLFLQYRVCLPQILFLSSQRQSHDGRDVIRTVASFIMKSVQPYLMLLGTGSQKDCRVNYHVNAVKQLATPGRVLIVVFCSVRYVVFEFFYTH